MAHADYDCCACCDRKMSGYTSPDPSTKEMLCSDCAVALAKDHGVFVRSGKELQAWVKEHDGNHVKTILSAVGFLACYYGNDVDDAVKAKGIAIDRDSRRIQADADRGKEERG